MGMGQEMRDFAAGFQSTAGIGQKISDRRAKAKATAIPDDSMLPGGDGPFGGNQTVPQVSSGIDTGTTGSTKLGNAGGEGFLKQAYGYYRQKGLGHAQAAGIAGNLQMESGGDPRVFSGARTGDSGSAAYAGQWRDKRRANLEKFAGGKPTLQQQLDFVLEEGNPQSPYADKGWAAAMPAFMAAKTPEEATGLFMNHFERPNADPKINGISKRIAWASSLQDSGGAAGPMIADATPPPAAAADDPNAGVIDDGSGDGSGGGDPATDGTYSPDAGITVDPLPEDVSMGAAPQVANWNQEMQAANGGVIPEPRYAPGGTVDKFNPARDYTQPIAPPAANTFVPRRVGQPPVGGNTVSGPSPSQLAFRKLQTQQTAVAPVVAAPAAPVAPKLRYRINPTDASRNFLGNHPIEYGNVNELDPRVRAYIEAYPTKAHVSSFDPALQGHPVSPFMGQPGGPTYPGTPTTPPTVSPLMPRHPVMAEGGIIPEPEEFARGGKVREQRASANHVGGNVPGVDLVDPGTRYSAANDTEYWQPAKPRKGKTSTGKSDKTTTKSTGKAAASATAEIADPHTNVARSETADPHTNVARAEISDPHAGVSPQVAVSPSYVVDPITGVPVRREPAAGGPPAPMIGAIPEPPAGSIGVAPAGIGGRLQQGPPAPPAPEPMGGGVTRPPTPPPFGDLEAASGANSARQRALLQQKFPGQIPYDGGSPVATMPQVPVGNNGPANLADKRPDYAKVISAAQYDIAAGVDPKQVGQRLKDMGITQELWPLDIQNKVMGFAEGGVIPERANANHVGGNVPGVNLVDPGTPSAQPEGAAPAGPPRRQPTPKLKNDVAKALDGGVKFITEHFQLKGNGAVPDPQDGANAQAGAQRFAAGEGATTPDEIKAVDDAIDPQRQLDEGERHMTRLAKTTTWYLEQNRPKDAKAAAASLLQYGATRFGQLGSLAGAAYSTYQQSNDPKDLQHTVKYLEAAYKLIPDGASIDVQLDPQSKQLMATRTDADGNEQQFEVKPEELQAMIAGAQSKSSYWQEIFALADPAGARQQAGWTHAAGVKAGDRAYETQKDTRKRALDAEATLGKEGRAATENDRRSARNAGAARTAKLEGEALIRSRPGKPGAGQVDPAVVGPLLGPAKAAKKAYDDNQTPENQAALDAAASSLYAASGMNSKWMLEQGIDPAGDFTYTAAGGGAAPGAAPGAGDPPVAGAQRMMDPKTGEQIWAVESAPGSGKWSKWVDD